MLAEFVLFLVRLYYNSIESWKMMTHVLRIKFRTPILVRQHSREASGHLAVRLNECKTFDETAFFKLVEYVSCVFSVKYLTIMLADNQSNLSFNIDASRCKVPFTLYSDFEPVNNLLDHSTQLSVNLIKSDSENLFLQKLKKFNDQDSVKPYPPDSLYSMTLKSFTGTTLYIIFSFLLF